MSGPLVNARTGEVVEIVSESPELLVLRATWPTSGNRVLPHLHPGMQERWEVLEGRARIDVDGVRSELGPGESVVAEPGQVHLAVNGGDVPAVVQIEMRPALRWAQFVQRLFAGDPPAELLAEFADEVRVPGAG